MKPNSFKKLNGASQFLTYEYKKEINKNVGEHFLISDLEVNRVLKQKKTAIKLSFKIPFKK